MTIRRVIIILIGYLLMSTSSIAETPSELVSETYQDWIVRCSSIIDNGKAVTFCEMSQDLRHSESGQRVLAIGIQDGGSGDSGIATVIAPFGLRLSSGLDILVPGRERIKTPFETCMPTGCIARVAFDQETLEAFKRGVSADIVVTANASGEDVTINLSLAGFTAAWNRLRELSLKIRTMSGIR